MRIFAPLECVTIAHVVRPLQIAKELRKHGVEVTFALSDRYRGIVEEAGFATQPLYCQDPKVLLNCVRTLNFKRQVESLPSYIEADLAAIEKAGNPDYVLSDFRFTIRFAAEHLGVPHIAVTNGYYSPYYDVLPDMPEALPMPGFLRKYPPLRLFLKHVVPQFHAIPYHQLCRRYGLKNVTKIRSGFDIVVSKTLTLLCDLPEITPQKDLPPHYQFVGPVLWEPDSQAEKIPENFDGKRRPLIYVTLGTSGQDDIAGSIVKSFAGSRYDVVLSTGSKPLTGLPSNIFSAGFVKASEVLKRASLLICHGGNGSIYQALDQAVPILCIATFYDQEWNGQRVRELGLGDTIFHSHLEKEGILPLVDRLVEDAEIRENAKMFQSKMKKWNGAELAAQKILALNAVPGENIARS